MRGPSFMAIDDIEALDRALEDVSPEAAGAAFKLMVKTFIRGKAFADDEAAARALHLQARRLCRVKDQFGELSRPPSWSRRPDSVSNAAANPN